MTPPEAPAITIGRRVIHAGAPLFVIAEIGLNHGGSIDRALALVDAAAQSGADAIKLQTIVAEELIAPGCPAPAHVKADSLAAFFATFELDEEAHARVAERARAHGLLVMATPFSERAVSMLDRVGVDAYKIASGDLTFPQLIARCAATRKPLVMSTGLASIDEVDDAVATALEGGAEQIALLHCVSAYPVPRGSENLRAIATLSRAFEVPVGLSDHGDDTFAVPMAVALGASLYERHLVLDDDLDAIDRAVSSTPRELAQTIAVAARATAAQGDGSKVCLPAEAVNRTPSRRALCAARDLPAGHRLTSGDLIALRPASGLPPSMLAELTGSRLQHAIARGTAIREEDVEFVERRRHAS